MNIIWFCGCIGRGVLLGHGKLLCSSYAIAVWLRVATGRGLYGKARPGWGIVSYRVGEM
jgi:hypothetical protein